MSLRKLLKLKEKADDAYHNSAFPIMSDEDYDKLVEEIERLGGEITVGATIRSGENRVKIPYWLGSLNKITPKSSAKLTKWLRDNFTDVIISEKLDGVSCLYVKNKDKICLYTRGDGIIGADISHLHQFIRNIPKNVSEENLVIRGELVIRKKDFIYDEYKNARSMVAGLVNSKTLEEGMKHVRFVAYEIIYELDETAIRPSRQISKLFELGFEVVRHGKESIQNISIDFLSELLTKWKETSEYNIDGIVITSNSKYIRNTDGNPKYAFAFKKIMDGDIQETTVLEVEWTVSKWGQLKPVVIIEPIVLKDITITRATAHHGKYVMDNGIGKGARISVIRSNDVIPYILNVIEPVEPNMPNDYTWDKNGVNILANRDDEKISEQSCIKLAVDFFRKLDIKHVGEKTVEKMFSYGLNNLIKILLASKEDLLKIFPEKTSERIYVNKQEGMKRVKIPTLLGATGIFGFGIGVKKVKSLFQKFPSILTDIDTMDKTQLFRKIQNIDGFSEITATKIVENIEFARDFLKKVGISVQVKTEKALSKLKNAKFVFSGFRDANLQGLIEDMGGSVMTSVSRNTTGVIVKTKSGPSTGKTDKAKTLGIPIITMEEFQKNFIE